MTTTDQRRIATNRDASEDDGAGPIDVLRDWIARMQQRGWVSDLADGIGSPAWFRSLGFLVVLLAATLAFWPDFSALQAAPGVDLTKDEREQYRSQMIMPLALGADSGRRMGPSRLVVPLASAPERPQIELTATYGSNDSLAAMLRRAGVGTGDAQDVESLILGVLDKDELKQGTGFNILLGRRPSPSQPRPLEALDFRARFDLALEIARDGGPLALTRRPIRVDDTPLRITGKVGSGLYRSARAAGAPGGAVQQYLKAIDGAVDLNREVSAEDEFDMIIAYRRAETGEVEVGDLLYAGINRHGTPRAQMLRFGPKGKFFDANGEGQVREGLVAPVNGPVSSRYGMRRHPILKIKRMHRGLDFRARSGSPIFAVTDGTVSMAGRNGGHGNYVRVGHGGGLSSGYSHISRIAVSRGQRVERGQVIGYVGSTGLSTGPHLHYELYRGGQNIDPSSVQFVIREQLSAAEMARFRAELARLRKVQPGAALEPLGTKTERPSEPVREIDRLAGT